MGSMRKHHAVYLKDTTGLVYSMQWAQEVLVYVETGQMGHVRRPENSSSDRRYPVRRLIKRLADKTLL
jgi:hypothetical protein